ncbi:MAG: MG2 domain-containing protein, partial [bacterium]
MNTIPASHTPDNQQGENRKPAHGLRRALLPVLIGAVVLLVSGAISEPVEPLPGGAHSGDYAADWQAVEVLIADQKLESASDMVAYIRETARKNGHEEPWTRALVEETRLRTALHGYETAVRFLREEPWPEDPLWRAVLELYYAESLVTYFQRYSYEIRRREHVASDESVDLKAWTKEQIVTEAHRAFHRAWSNRESWGARSLGLLSVYIEQNDYPARIRGTLRDAVTYMWAHLLANQSLWQPEDDNTMYLLDTTALILGDADSEVDPADPAIHPLRRLGFVLDDLERWHTDHERPEAALETRLFRLRSLFAAFEHEQDKQTVIDHLVQVQSAFDHAYSWWAMGQWQLAKFFKEGPGDHPYVAAHRAAVVGRDRHPETVGGRRCAHLAAVLVAPSYELTAMAVDAAHQRSIQISHENLDRLYFRAWRLDLAERVAGLNSDASLWPDKEEISDLINRLPADLSWTVDLPPTEDFQRHQTYTTLPADRKGAYVVTASTRQDFRDDNCPHSVIDIIVSDLVLLQRDLPEKLEFSARSGATGKPVAGSTVAVYRYMSRNGSTLLRSAETAEDGRMSCDKPPEYYNGFAFARKGDDLALIRRYRTGPPHQPSGYIRSFVYTDRSIYRPGQTLHWKVVAYQSAEGGNPDFQTLPHHDLVVTLYDGNHREVAADTLQTNSFGSASGNFVVPHGWMLGNWQLESSLNARATVKVEEYKRPTFEVTVDDPADSLRLNEPATVTGQVKYYFGLPVTAGEVEWQLSRIPKYPRWWRWDQSGYAIVANGQTSLDKDGTFSVNFTPRADDRLSDTEGVSYIYRLVVTVTDEGGETRSVTRHIRVGFLSVAASIGSDLGFEHAGAPVLLTVKRTSLDGVASPGAGRWRLMDLEQPENAVLPADLPVLFPPGDEDPYRTPGDLLNPRWQSDLDIERNLHRWADGRQLDDGILEHDNDGDGSIELAGLVAGAYRLHYETEDDFGGICRVHHDFLVVDSRSTHLALPLVLQAERPSVAVGDTARLFVHSGLPGQEMVLEIYQGNRRLRRWVMLSGQDMELLEIPVGDHLRGGFSVHLTTLRDFQLMRSTMHIFVPWDDRKLHVEFATFRDRLRPGTSETFRVTVRDAAGQFDESLVTEGAAELLAYMYDRSLDVFARHNTPQPFSLYPRYWHELDLERSLGMARERWFGAQGSSNVPGFPRLREDRLYFIDGYGIGGVGGRRGELYVRGGRRGAIADDTLNLPDVIVSEGIEIPVLDAFDVEG